MFKKITSILAALLFTVSTSNSAEFINILTGGTSGVYYPLGVGISKIYGEKIKDANVERKIAIRGEEKQKHEFMPSKSPSRGISDDFAVELEKYLKKNSLFK